MFVNVPARAADLQGDARPRAVMDTGTPKGMGDFVKAGLPKLARVVPVYRDEFVALVGDAEKRQWAE